MADIIDILESITSNVSGLEATTRAINDFKKAKEEALKAGDAKALLQLENLEKSTKKYLRAKEKQLELEEELQKVHKEDAKVSQKLRNELKKNMSELARQERILTHAKQEAVDAQEKQTAAIIANNEAMMDAWKQTTLLGKAYSGLTSGFAKVAGGITAGSLALKAWNRYTEGAEIRQNILIQQFRGFTDATTGAAESMVGAGLKAEQMSNALIKARSTAIRMGVDVGVVNEAMVDFARIAGTDNPEALGNLTAATVTVARTMGITMPEAVDFVRTRMDKFGGTAASAVVALHNIRTETENVNHIFGRTVVRADDIAKSLLDISRSTTVYAIDQRFVSGILRDNIARLAAMGDSYDLARRKAQAFTEAVTGEAPEWMKVLAGEDLVGDMQSVFKGVDLNATTKEGQALAKEAVDEFKDEFGAQLDAAAPGLSDQVVDIFKQMQTGDIQQYEGMRLIQEMTAGSEVGIAAMNKQLVKLGKTSQGIEVIAQQFGKTRVEAHGMVQQAKEYQARQEEINKLVADPSSLNAIKSKKKLSDEEQKIFDKYRGQLKAVLKDERISEHQKKRDLREIIKTRDLEIEQRREAAILADRDARAQEAAAKAKPRIDEYKAKIKVETEKIAALGKHVEKLREELKEDKDDPVKKKALEKAEAQLREARIQRNLNQNILNSAEETVAQAKTKEGKDKTSDEKMIDIANKNLAEFKGYSDSTGKSLEATVNELATIRNLLIGAIALWAGGSIFKGLAGHFSRGGTWKSLGKTIAGSVGNAVKGPFDSVRKMFRGGGGPSGGGGIKPPSGKMLPSKTIGEKATQQTLKDQHRINTLKAAGDKESLKKAERLESKLKAAETSKLPIEEKGGKLTKAAPGVKKGPITDMADKAKTKYDRMTKSLTKGSDLVKDTFKETGETVTKKADVAKGVTQTVGKSVAGKAGTGVKAVGKAGKALKLAKAIPGVGIFAGGAIAISQGWDIYTKWKAGEPVSASDKAKMTASLGSMIPFIGTAIAISDVTAESTGLYKELDEAFPATKTMIPQLKDAGDLKIKPSLNFGNLQANTVNTTQGMPIIQQLTAAQSENQQQAAAQGGAQNVVNTGAVGVNNLAAAAGDTSQAMGSLGPMNPDGSVTLTIKNFGESIGRAQLQMNRRPRQPGAVG